MVSMAQEMKGWGTDVPSLPPAISALPGSQDHSDRDWKVRGVSCPSALPGSHASPCLSEQGPAGPQAGT